MHKEEKCYNLQNLDGAIDLGNFTNRATCIMLGGNGKDSHESVRRSKHEGFSNKISQPMQKMSERGYPPPLPETVRNLDDSGRSGFGRCRDTDVHGVLAEKCRACESGAYLGVRSPGLERVALCELRL